MLLKMAIFILFMAELYSILYIYHVFLSQSSIDGYLGYFHALAIVNNAAMNLGCKYLFELQFSTFLDICPGVGLMDHIVVLFLVL